MDFGEKIKNARKAKKLTQRQFAELIGAKHNSISNWENNQNKPDPDTIERICGVLEITPSYLLGVGEEHSISRTERILLDNYNMLNNEGKKKLLEYSDDLVCSSKYTSNTDYLEPIAAHGDITKNNKIDPRDIADMDNWE